MIRKINGISYNPTQGLTNITYSVGTTETIIGSCLLPANTVKQYDLLGIQSRVVRIDGETPLGTITTKMRIGASLTTSATQIAIFNTPTSATNYIQLDRRLSIQSVSGGGNQTFVLPPTTSIQSDRSAELTSVSQIAFNWTVDLYIIVTATASVPQVLNCGYIITDLIESPIAVS
jgi:hypothetical protein